MSNLLYLRPQYDADILDDPTSEDTRFDWVVLDATGNTVLSGHDHLRATVLSELENEGVQEPQLIGVIPAFDVASCTARIPGKQSRFIRQALPFAVEEQLAQDVESIHLALGSRHGEIWQVAAIDQERMGGWLALFEAWELPINAVVADAALVPTPQCRWAVVMDGSLALVAGSHGEWFDVPAAGLGVFLEALIEEQGGDAQPPAVDLHVPEEDATERQVELAALEQNPDFDLHQHPLDIPILQFLARSHHRHPSRSIDLCQGPFAQRNQEASPLRRWRAVAAVAMIGVVLQLAMMIGDGIYHQQRAEAFEGEAMALFRDIFPDDTRATPGNLRRVMESRLRAAEQGGSDAEFLTMLRYAGQEYRKLDDASQIRFDSISFNRNRGELIMELRGDSFSRLDSMRRGLNESGLRARIGSVVNEPDHTRGRITVTGGDS